MIIVIASMLLLKRMITGTKTSKNLGTNKFQQIERFCNSPNSQPYNLLQGREWLQVYTGLDTVHVYSTKQLQLQVYSGSNRKQQYSSLTAPSKLLATLTGKIPFCKIYNTSELLVQTKSMSLIRIFIWAKQSVCTSLNENTVTLSLLIIPRNIFFWLGLS